MNESQAIKSKMKTKKPTVITINMHDDEEFRLFIKEAFSAEKNANKANEARKKKKDLQTDSNARENDGPEEVGGELSVHVYSFIWSFTCL